MSLFRELLAAKPVRTPLEFGINENVRITKIDNTPRKNKDGQKLAQNTFVTFSKFNSEGTKIAGSEFRYFNLDHESPYVRENFANQVGQLQDIANSLNPGSVIDPTKDYTDPDELYADLESKKGCRAFMDDMWDQFEAAVGEIVGDECPMLRVKVVTSKDGKYLQLPGRETHVVEVMDEDCTLNITAYEEKMRAKGLEAPSATPDAKGNAPEEGAKATSTSAIDGL
jgi:hypothetical protein